MENTNQTYLHVARLLSKILLITGAVWLVLIFMNPLSYFSFGNGVLSILGAILMQAVRMVSFCLLPFLALRKNPFPHWKAVTPLAFLLFFSFTDYIYPQIAHKYFNLSSSLWFVLYAAACIGGYKLLINGYSKKCAIIAGISGGIVLLKQLWSVVYTLISIPHILKRLPSSFRYDILSAIDSLLSPIVAFVMPLFLAICVLFVIARLKGEMDLNDPIPKDSNNKDSDPMVASYMMIVLALCWAGLVAMFGGWFGSSSGGGGSYGGTCQFDGCSSKAVGPTYEFCSYHKKALNDIWDVEYQQEHY